MSDTQLAELEALLRRILHEEKGIDLELHAKRCEFVDMLIEREERRKEALKKFKMSFIGGLALALLGGLGWLGALVVEAFRNGPPPGSTH